MKDYYSSEIQLRKPALEAYRFVLNDSGIQSSETFFIDDSKENIEAANQVGMHTFLMSPEVDFQRIF